MALIPYRRRGATLTRLQDEMSELFGRFFGGWEEPFVAGWTPALDVAEREDAIVVKAELPGLTVEDIDISAEAKTLTVSGEKKEQAEQKGENYHHVERRYGSFRRSVALPSTVDPTKIEATYRDGVLTVTLPKSEAAKPKKIKVKTE